MRSSKSRSRNKSRSNNNRSVGNIVNRVFDSSGPEGKVRGTPQQIIDKYNQLARDAQLAGDRVATENFQQHAEHYLRMLSEAQKEQDARRDEQERQNRERQAERDRDRSRRQERDVTDESDLSDAPQPDVVDPMMNEDSGLVETPESKDVAKPKRPRRSKPKPVVVDENASASEAASESGRDQGDQGDSSDAPEAAE